jgi:hypothetical protein
LKTGENIMNEKKLNKLFMIAIILIVHITIIFASGNDKNYSIEQNNSALDTTNIKIMVPAYFDPSSNYWDRMATQAAKMPGRIWAIMNPNSGPVAKVDSSYTRVINEMHSHHGNVIAYVRTNYGSIPLDTCKRQIDTYFSQYPTLDGIFFDEQQNASGKESYYQTLYNYVKSKSAAGLVVANPGTNTVAGYLFYNNQRVTDVICIFESNTGFDSFTASTLIKSYSSSNWFALPYNTSASQWLSRLTRAVSNNIGWIYLTDDTGGNPWDTLPAYFENLCNYIITGVYVPDNYNGLINIDGNFNDWQYVPKLNISPNPSADTGDSPSPDADFINFWATNDTANLFISYQVAGTITSNYFYHIFIDTDTNLTTGYRYQDSASVGAELMIENDILYKYTGTGGANWSWSVIGGFHKANTGGRTEMSIPLSALSSNKKSIRLIFQSNSSLAPSYSFMEIDPTNYKNQFYTFSFNKITEVNKSRQMIGANFILEQNYPNPFNPTTTINYSVPKASFVTIKVYDVLGKIVSTLVNTNKPAGNYSVGFNASKLESGIYFYRMTSGLFSETKKILLLK